MPADPLVPFRWPAAWKSAAPLRLLAASPFNCVLADSATAAYLAGPAGNAGLRVLDSGRLPDGLAASVLGDLVWPRIRLSVPGNAEAVAAAPTGAPWIDSNSWRVRLARSRAPGRPVWLNFDRSRDDGEADAAAYLVAIADSAASGARWIVSLDARLAAGVASGNSEAVNAWRAICKTATFFEKRHEWSAFEPWGPLGIVSTFAGAHEFMGHELLNLAARRGLLYRVFDRSLAAVPDLGGLTAILWADIDPPSEPWKDALLRFAGGGGLAIVPRALARSFPQSAPVPCAVAGYDMQALGKGRLAVATRDQDDPYFLAADVHSLVSRRNDPVRLFNGRSLWLHYAIDRAKDAALMQLVGFTARPRDTVTLTPSRKWRWVAMYTPDADRPRALEPVMVDGNPEYRLPAFSYYAALEFRS